MSIGGVGAVMIMLLIYFQLYRILNESALVSITIFNFLLIFLLFPLGGPLFPKVCLLVGGNTVGLLWYFVKSSFGVTLAFYSGAEASKIVTVVIGPIIDWVWIVSVWSFGLSILASAQNRNEGHREEK